MNECTRAIVCRHQGIGGMPQDSREVCHELLSVGPCPLVQGGVGPNIEAQ